MRMHRFVQKFQSILDRLELRDVMVEDSGTYVLTVSNDHGSTQSSANVLVKGER